MKCHQSDIVNILFYDFTVRNSGVVQSRPALVQKLGVAHTSGDACTPPECQFDRHLTAYFTPIQWMVSFPGLILITQVFRDFPLRYPLETEVQVTTADVISDRRSVNDVNATANNADHMVFLNDPDPVEFPSSSAQCGDVSLLSVSCEIPDSFCINIGVTQAGQVEVILDFDNNGVYD